MKIKISDRLIGEGELCFIIAEAGVNHNGDINLAKKLIDVAKDAGADAVKFQTFKTEYLVTQDAPIAEYQKKNKGTAETQYKMLKKLELTYADFEELFEYCKKRKIIFLSTPYDEKSVDFLTGLEVPAIKIGSGEITNIPFLKYIAQKKLPIILSTGMSDLKEVKDAVETIKSTGNDKLILLHCTSNYPTRVEDCNLRTMKTLESAFNLPVGFSDHTLGIEIPSVTVAMGAKVIEKHFTLDKNLPGPDHKASLQPNELKEMVKAIRNVEKTLGDGIKRPTKDEEEMKRTARRSIVAKVDIPRRITITEDMLTVKRPGTGIEAKNINMVIGKKAQVNIKKDEMITMEMLSE